ncbi:MAG: hypothetical protein ACREE0_20255 [Phenylobacterium sp.]
MRRFPLTAVLIALACAACSKEAATPAPAPVEAANTLPAVETPPPPPPAAPELVETAAVDAAPSSSSPIQIVKPASPSPERVVRVVPARERRIHALINNAISRDVTGATEEDAAMWQARRAACETQACVDRAYAAQETELRKWEGSEDIH